MLKKSTSLHKIPYYDLATDTLDSVDKDKNEYHDVMCVCPAQGDCSDGLRPEQAGYKFQFNYSIQPTMEPISYRLKGYKQNASLTYNDLGSSGGEYDISEPVIEEVQMYMNFILETYFPDHDNDTIKAVVDNFQAYEWNEYDNWALSNKIFQKMKRFQWKGEEYDPTSDLMSVCMGVNVQSSTYIVTAKFTIIDQHNMPLPQI